MVVASTSAITLTPTEGGTYATSTAFGSGYVACYGLQVSCIDTAPDNNIDYYYKIYTMDSRGNFSETGATPPESPVTPTGPPPSLTQTHFRWRNDDGDEVNATFAQAEDNAIPAGDNVNKGDRKRLRFVLSNGVGGGSASGYQYQLEHASGTCTAWMAVSNSDTNGTHFTMDGSQYISGEEATTDLAGMTNPGGSSFVAGLINDTSSLVSDHTLGANEFTELEYSIRSTFNAEVGLIYCFRLTNSGDDTNFSYSNEPQITLSSFKRNSGGSEFENYGTGAIRTGGGAGGGGAIPDDETGTGDPAGGGDAGGGGGDVGGAFTTFLGPDGEEMLTQLATALTDLLETLQYYNNLSANNTQL
jgi:hypothetical protein